MFESKIKVNGESESRPLALLVQTANKFASSIKIQMNDKIINAKSIMGVIALGNIYGEEITLMADGADEKTAIAELSDFLTK